MEEEIKKQVTPKEFKQLVKLIKDHQNVSKLYTAEEYLSNILIKKEDSYSDFVLESFLKFNRHEKIFKCIVENFFSLYHWKEDNNFTVRLILHILVFEINENTLNAIIETFLPLKQLLLKNVLDYVTKEEYLILMTEVTCKIFGSDYTLEVLIQPLMTNMKYIEILQNYLADQQEKKRIVPRPVTKPKSPRAGISKPLVRSVIPPPDPVYLPFTPNEIPKTTYECDASIIKKIQNEHNKNRVAALKLLELARKNAFSCAQLKEKTETSVLEEDRIIKAKKIPKFKKVNIKGNTTTLMREAAQMVKKCEAEIKKIDELSTTARDFSLYEELEHEERKKMEIENLQNIHKRHLQGLLTREEAILAKQNLIKANREKMEEFKVEKQELNMKLGEWREEEQQKLKALVEKAQSIEKAAKDAQKGSLEDKQRFVKMMQEEKRQMFNKAMEEKERELNRKVELIKDLKALESLKDLNKKEFDPTESANLGLMCEMSIAELQERLFLLKIEVEEDLKTKKKQICETRRQRRDLLDQVQQFVEQNRHVKPKEKLKQAEAFIVEDTAEIIALRNRIDEARKKRIQNAYAN